MSAEGMESVVEPAVPDTPPDSGPTPEVSGASDPPAESGHWTAKYPTVTGNPMFERFENEEAAFASHMSLNQKLSSSGTKAPGDKASDAEWGEFYDKMGRPDTAKGYFDGLERPNSTAWNDDLVVNMAAEMQRQGLSAKQGNALLSKYIEDTGGDIANYEDSRANAHNRSVQALQEMWGPNEYQLRLAEADAGGKAAFEEGWGDLVKLQLSDGSVLGNHVAFASGLQKLGFKLGEGAMLGVESQTAHGYTQKSALAKIEDLKGDKEHNAAVTNPEHPLHSEKNQMDMDLYRVAYPEG